MSEVSETLAQYEARLTAALTRIQAGLGKWPAAAVEAVQFDAKEELQAPEPENEGTIARLTAALQEERTANAQLEKRVRQIRNRQQARVAELEGQVSNLTEQLEMAQANVVKMRRNSEDARLALSALQDAARDGTTEPHLINKAMMAELESLRAERAADANEIAEVITAIETARGAAAEGEHA
ncbi:MAG: hypothetical protein AAGI10_00470 [Pseudomonadota bacterium]